MMNNITIYAYSALTIVLFTIGWKLNKKLKSTIFNSFVLSLGLIVAVLIIGKIPFNNYYQGNAPLNQLLNVSVVALAIPLYEQLPQIRKHWQKITIVVGIGTFLTMLSGVLFALWLGADKTTVASLLPKSVSTPIALAITKGIEGNLALSAVAVVIAGISGSAFGLAILNRLNVNNARAVGLSMGAVSHALGTARSMDYSIKAGSYASLSLVLCGIISSISAPFIFKLIIWLWF